MTAPAQAIGAMSSGRVFLVGLLSSRARLRFPGHPQAPTITPVRRHHCSERQTGTSLTVSLQGVTPRRKMMSSPPNAQIHRISLIPQGEINPKSWRSERVEFSIIEIEQRKQ